MRFKWIRVILGKKQKQEHLGLGPEQDSLNRTPGLFARRRNHESRKPKKGSN